MQREPLVSIIIPVFNGENYLKEAIDSAILQTYKNIEVIVVNDGSTDNTEQIAISYGDRIKYVKKENGGVSSALNLGIKLMKGEYFSWLSHDDKYPSNKIESQIKALSESGYRNSVIAFCDTVQINRFGDVIRKKRKNKYLIGDKTNKWDLSLFSLVKTGGFNGCALLVPKQILVDAGGFDEEMRYSQDFFMWSKLFILGCSVFYCTDTFVLNRIHSRQTTHTKKELFYNDSFKIATHLYAPLLNVSSKKRNFIFLYAIRFAKYNCKDSAHLYIQRGKNDSILSLLNIISIKAVLIYGCFRIFFRKLYYRVFKKVRTQ